VGELKERRYGQNWGTQTASDRNKRHGMKVTLFTSREFLLIGNTRRPISDPEPSIFNLDPKIQIKEFLTYSNIIFFILPLFYVV
jgi:hypothetical protein